MLNILYSIYLCIKIYLSIDLKNVLMIAPDECCNECVLKLSEYAEEAILLLAAERDSQKK